jgi:hypothetical protein
MINNIKDVFYQIPLRLNNFFPNFYRSVGLWIYGLLLGTNIYFCFIYHILKRILPLMIT